VGGLYVHTCLAKLIQDYAKLSPLDDQNGISVGIYSAFMQRCYACIENGMADFPGIAPSR
jgi:hypothetical protein